MFGLSYEDWDELVMCSSMYGWAAEGTILKPKIGLLYSWQCLFLRHPQEEILRDVLRVVGRSLDV